VNGNAQQMTVAGNPTISAPDTPHTQDEFIALTVDNPSTVPMQATFSDFMYTPLNGSNDLALLPDIHPQVPLPLPGFTTYLTPGDAWGLNYALQAQPVAGESTIAGIGANITLWQYSNRHAFAVYTATGALPSSQQQTLLDSFIVAQARGALVSQLAGGQVTQPLVVGAQSWTESEFTYRSQGITYGLLAFAATHENATLMVMGTAPVRLVKGNYEYDAFWEEAFFQALNSFTFLK
jgi:hypothetical protein